MEEKKTLISIGRQFGSGGKEVAVVIGKKLGIPVYDSELISHAAEESGFSKELFAKNDEKRGFFTASNFITLSRFSSGESFVHENNIFQIQSQVMRNIAEKGPAIFIGRCSDYILRDMDILSVFITAPLEDRIKRVAERNGISEDQAKSLISKEDRSRETYYNYYTFGNWGVAGNYDLCLDSKMMGIEGTADIIIEIAKRKGLI